MPGIFTVQTYTYYSFLRYWIRLGCVDGQASCFLSCIRLTRPHPVYRCCPTGTKQFPSKLRSLFSQSIIIQCDKAGTQLYLDFLIGKLSLTQENGLYHISQDTAIIILGEVLCPSQFVLCHCGRRKGLKLICKAPLSMENY